MIKITNLNKYFYRHKNNEIHVINNTTLEFPQTGLVAILGESGCGKTTLLNVMGGLDNFNSGTLEIDKFKVEKYRSSVMDRIRNEKIGYIFQNYLLLQQKTVYYNLMLTLNMYDISLDEKNSRIDYVLKSVGMLKYKKKRVAELSGGQQQRIAIARALIKSPSLILADEPTGNLDEKNTIQIMNIIKKISKTTLVILVSHEKSIANSYADQIIEIEDGTIKANYKNDNATTYKFKDDQILHLKDYKVTSIDKEGISLNFYTNNPVELDLKIVYEKGKYYISSSQNIYFVDDNTEVKMVDDHKSVFDVEANMIENDYHLDKLKFKKIPRLSFKENVKIALENLKSVRKKSIFLFISLIIMSCLTLWCMQSMVNARKIDIKNLANSDSHLYTATIKKGDAKIKEEDLRLEYEKIYKDFVNKNQNIEIIPTGLYDLEFNYNSFIQVSNGRYDLRQMTFVNVDNISSDDLIYGRMPSNASEIVVDKWVLEKLLFSTSLYNLMSLSNFVNQELKILGETISLKICGIAKTNNSSIYANKWLLLSLYPSLMRKKGQTIIPLSEYLKYEDADQTLTLEKDEIFTTYVVTHGYTDYINIDINDDQNLKYKVKSEIKTINCPFTIVVPDELAYEDVLASSFVYTKDNIYFYCDNNKEKETVKAYFDKIAEYYKNNEGIKLDITHKSVYDDSLQPYYETAQKTVSSRIVIVVTIIAISALIIYFSMRSFAIKNIYDIGVYRANGISKGSIVLIFAIEIFCIALMTTVLGSFIFYLIMNLISNIPILIGSLSISFTSFLISTSSLLIIDVLIGIIPILSYMRLTPSQILSKYDI